MLILLRGAVNQLLLLRHLRSCRHRWCRRGESRAAYLVVSWASREIPVEENFTPGNRRERSYAANLCRRLGGGKTLFRGFWLAVRLAFGERGVLPTGGIVSSSNI